MPGNDTLLGGMETGNSFSAIHCLDADEIIDGTNVPGSSSVDISGFPMYGSVHYKFVRAFYILAFLYSVLVVFIIAPFCVPINAESLGQPYIWGWHFIFLEYWGVFTTMVYFGTCIVDMQLYAYKHWLSSSFHWHRDRFFTLVITVAFFIIIGYLCVILPISEHSGKRKSCPLTSIAQGSTSVLIIIDLFVVRHAYAQSARDLVMEIFLVYSYGLGYLCVNMYSHKKNHIWPYAFQNRMSTLVRSIVYPSAFFVIVFLYFMGYWITKKYWKLGFRRRYRLIMDFFDH